jgi:hypothetical protein
MKNNWFKIALLLIILFLGYLFALNGRYDINENGAVVVDKWSERIYLPISGSYYDIKDVVKHNLPEK